MINEGGKIFAVGPQKISVVSERRCNYSRRALRGRAASSGRLIGIAEGVIVVAC